MSNIELEKIKLRLINEFKKPDSPIHRLTMNHGRQAVRTSFYINPENIALVVNPSQDEDNGVTLTFIDEGQAHEKAWDYDNSFNTQSACNYNFYREDCWIDVGQELIHFGLTKETISVSKEFEIDFKEEVMPYQITYDIVSGLLSPVYHERNEHVSYFINQSRQCKSDKVLTDKYFHFTPDETFIQKLKGTVSTNSNEGLDAYANELINAFLVPELMLQHDKGDTSMIMSLRVLCRMHNERLETHIDID